MIIGIKINFSDKFREKKCYEAAIFEMFHEENIKAGAGKDWQ
jgi:hypothetical protein